MTVKVLRWMLGSGGDTIIKLVLDSNNNWHSQHKYKGLENGKTAIEINYNLVLKKRKDTLIQGTKDDPTINNIFLIDFLTKLSKDEIINKMIEKSPYLQENRHLQNIHILIDKLFL